ncbi:MAG: cupin domain-containing protein [Chloroflexota bacterium]
MTQYVFHPDDAIRYRFPTHTNDLITDRADGAASEAFFVVLEPGETVPIHQHVGVEQVWFVLEGEGDARFGPDAAESHPIRPGDYVRTPPETFHSTRCVGDRRLVYLSIDCFVAGPPPDEPTWDSHVDVMCATNGWDRDSVRHGRVEGDARAIPGRPASIPAAARPATSE